MSRHSETPISNEELQAAQEWMAPEEASASAVREQYFRQPKDSIELKEPLLTPEGERVPPTPEQIEIMDRRLAALERVVGGSEMDWQIDGGLAISAYNGDYLGYHKDIDISLDEQDVPELQRRGLAAGYGMFIGEIVGNTPGEAEYKIRQADVATFLKDRHHRFLITADADGKIEKGGDLDFIDIHLRPKNEAGQEYGAGGLPLPVSWNETHTVEFRGMKVQVPSLAKVAYFKLYAGRPVDVGDLRAIAQSDHFTPEQFTELEDMISQEQKAKIRDFQSLLERTAAVMSSAVTEEEVRDCFYEDEGNWTRDYSWDGRSALAKMFFEVAQTDMTAAQEQVIQAMINTLPHEHEDHVEEMRTIMAERGTR